VARRGLDRDRVVEAAATIADAGGLDAVTLARVASELGVRSPSLYNHVAGREGLVRAIAVRATRELGVALRRAATGKAGAGAVAAVADAHRAYALAHPGRYAATVRAPAAGDAEHEAAAAEVVDVLLAVAGSMGLEGDDRVHAVRALRSAVHGFAALEAGGGFAIPVDPDASFRRLVDALAGGLRPD
jgi:AcrR family transcriptional regulator